MNTAQFIRARARIERKRRCRTKALRHVEREAGAVPLIVRRRVIGWRLPDGAIVCVKRRCQTRNLADTDLRTMRGEFGGHTTPARSYQCGLCKGWHLTSKVIARELL